MSTEHDEAMADHEGKFLALVGCVGYLFGERLRASPDPDALAAQLFGVLRAGVTSAPLDDTDALVRRCRESALRTLSQIETMAASLARPDDEPDRP